MGSSGEMIFFSFVPSGRVRTRTKTFFLILSVWISSSDAKETRFAAPVKIGSDFRFRLISRDDVSASSGSGLRLGSSPSLLKALF